MKYAQAASLARKWHGSISPFCDRFSSAGSLRRKLDEVSDIDFVVVPKSTDIQPALLGLPILGNPKVDVLYEALAVMARREMFEPGKGFKPFFRNCKLLLPQGIKIDLSAVREPAQWGVILALRTGPEDFSHWLVSNKELGGPLDDGLICQDGAIGHWRTKVNTLGQLTRERTDVIATPEEKDVFDLLGLRYLEPQLRRADWRRRVSL